MLRLVIEVNAQGQVQVHGPLDQKVVCLGVLELAKVAVLNFKAEEHRIIPAGIMPVPVRNGG